MPRTYEPIASQTLGSATASVTFSSIPSTYTDLILVSSFSETAVYGDSAIRFNSDSATNYSTTILYGTGAAAGSFRWSNISGCRLQNLPTNGAATVEILNYANTSTHKTALHRGFGGGGSFEPQRGVSLWRSTAAISSVTHVSLGTTFKAGSTFSLYGIKAA
jgi:hypothetical protein